MTSNKKDHMTWRRNLEGDEDVLKMSVSYEAEQKNQK